MKLCLSMLAAAWVFALASPATAEVLPVNLQEMATRGGRIVTGRVAAVQAGFHPRYTRVRVTYVTVTVEAALKGVNARQFTFMQFGGADMDAIFDLPQFKAGEEVMLFLYPESRVGFTSPVGGAQGKFSVRRDPVSGERTIVNGFGNRGLFDGMNVGPIGRPAFTGAGRDELRYESFVALVRDLLR